MKKNQICPISIHSKRVLLYFYFLFLLSFLLLFFSGDKSEVLDIENPDLERFPLFAKGTPYKGFLQPGDVLFIPGEFSFFFTIYFIYLLSILFLLNLLFLLILIFNLGMDFLLLLNINFSGFTKVPISTKVIHYYRY